MAFCKYCGAKLEDGQVCSCEMAQAQLKEAALEAAVPAADEMQPETCAVQAEIQNEASPEAKTDENMPPQDVSGEYHDVQPEPSASSPAPAASEAAAKKTAAKAVKTVLGIFKAPASNGAAFIASGETREAYAAAAAQAVLSAFLILIYISKLNGLVDNFSYFADTSEYKIPVFGPMVLTIVVTLFMSAVFAGLLTLFGKVFKAGWGFSESVRVCGVRASVLSVFTAAALIVSIADIKSGAVIFGIGMFLSVFFVQGAFLESRREKKDRAVYILICVYVILLWVFSIVFKNILSGYVEKAADSIYDILSYLKYWL